MGVGCAGWGGVTSIAGGRGGGWMSMEAGQGGGTALALCVCVCEVPTGAPLHLYAPCVAERSVEEGQRMVVGLQATQHPLSATASRHE